MPLKTGSVHEICFEIQILRAGDSFHPFIAGSNFPKSDLNVDLSYYLGRAFIFGPF